MVRFYNNSDEDNCDPCKDNTPRCIECGEIRRDESGEIDARVEGGMKCGVCAYA